SGKVPDDLVARGSAAYSNSVKKVWDYGGGVGGPILRDKLWFYGSARAWGTQAYGANLYFNQSSVFYRYVPDLTRPAYSDSFIKDIGGRLNWRVNDKNTITTDVHYEQSCQCYLTISLGLPTSPEASYSFRYGGAGSIAPIPWTTKWSYAASSKLLIQA